MDKHQATIDRLSDAVNTMDECSQAASERIAAILDMATDSLMSGRLMRDGELLSTLLCMLAQANDEWASTIMEKAAEVGCAHTPERANLVIGSAMTEQRGAYV